MELAPLAWRTPCAAADSAAQGDFVGQDGDLAGDSDGPFARDSCWGEAWAPHWMAAAAGLSGGLLADEV